MKSWSSTAAQSHTESFTLLFISMANENISSVLWELSETSPIIYPYQCILFAFSWGRGVSSGKWKSGFPFIGLSWDTLRNGLLFFPYFLNYHHLCIESFYENRRTNIKPENDSAFFARWSSCSHIVFHSTFHFLLFFSQKKEGGANKS